MFTFEEFNNFSTFKASHTEALNKVLESLDRKKLNEASVPLGRKELMEEVEEAVNRNVALITSLYKFFGRFINRMRVVYTWSIPTMGVDQFSNLYINPEFAHELTDKQMVFVLCHEILHIVLIHIERGKVKGALPDDQEGWNVAADHEVNTILVDEGLMTYDEVKAMKALLDKRFAEMVAETIYDENPPGPESDPTQLVAAEVGDYIATKDGKFGQVKAINADGTYQYKEKTLAEIQKAYEDGDMKSGSLTV